MTKNRFDFRGIHTATEKTHFFLVAPENAGEWNFFFNVFSRKVSYASDIK